MAEEKKCFIIMPLTTPETMLDKYRDGKDHFNHVLQCLFIPGIKQAGYNPIPPIAKGSDLIHADIINNLETSEIVLCDMSCLNPNAFFEFGIRTSLNKPVCVVKDEHTLKVPFDTGILNYREYQSSLDPWFIETEIKKICEHITTSAQRSKGENTLWKYFGLKTEAAPYKGEIGADSKLEYISMQIDSMHQTINSLLQSQLVTKAKKVEEPINLSEIYRVLVERIPPEMKILQLKMEGPRDLVVYYEGEIEPRRLSLLKIRLRTLFGVRSRFEGTLFPSDESTDAK
ncbi:MAG: hypothetical protein WCE90_09095 [Candidatus Zixiibacteriota bacterium]